MNIETVNELIASLESAGELSIKERKYLELAKAYQQMAAENVALKDEVPLGAIENGRAFADRLEAYPFECQGGNLNMCSDWQELRRCFEHLSEWTMHGQSETPATDRIYAGIKADGLPANIAEIIDSGDLETICYESERSYAEDFRLALYNFRQLREGAK
ncbi:hypothetical protein [Klebsiella pneumoniae]|uniref:hypothetical protein n=1 Tax=Klebsiella pneumoniae TaxID=573 RepID=UPI001968D270|nr:hypothetical protein [Klebsiella pneumoniae]